MEENYKNFGTNNEKEISDYLKGKFYRDLDEKWKGHIKVMFPKVKDTDYITSWRCYDKIGKPDINIRVGYSIAKISIKTGRSPAVHQESINSFLSFLSELGFSEKTLRAIELYQYGRTPEISNNGKPYSKEELEDIFKDRFIEANEELNSDDEKLKKIISRCVFKGRLEESKEIDYLYYGILNNGILLSRAQIEEILLKDKSHYKKTLHFGGLLFQSKGRDPKSVDAYKCAIRWPMLTKFFYEFDPDKFIQENYDNERLEKEKVHNL